MVTENTTPNRGYQEPAVGNTLEVDVGRLIAALRAIDVDVADALAQIVAKAGLASPAFTGTPTAPTAAPGTDSGQLATTAFVKAALAALVGLAPEALDTIEELAAASENNSDLIDLLESAVALKADAAATTAALAGKADANVSVRVDAAQSFTPTQQAQARTNIGAPLKGHIYGLTLSNNATDATNDIDIAAGEAASVETTPVLMLLATSMTKQLDSTWSVGTNAGGRDTGSISDGVWYVFLIQRSDTGVTDVLFSKSRTSPTMPANYDRKRRIGSFIRYSSAICAFVQTGDRYEITPSIPDVVAASLSTTQQTVTVSLPPEMIGLFRIRVSPASGASFNVIISGVDISANSNEASISAASTGGAAAGEFAIRVNSSGQIKHRSVGTVGASNIVINSFGWIDTRGRG